MRSPARSWRRRAAPCSGLLSHATQQPTTAWQLLGAMEHRRSARRHHSSMAEALPIRALLRQQPGCMIVAALVPSGQLRRRLGSPQAALASP